MPIDANAPERNQEFPGFEEEDRKTWRLIFSLKTRENISIEYALRKFSTQTTPVKVGNYEFRNSHENEREQAKTLLEKYGFWLKESNNPFGRFEDNFYQRLSTFLKNQ